MPDTEPINIKFLLNNDAVRQMAEQVKASIRGVRDTGIQDAEKFGSEFTRVFERISTNLSEAFGTEKIAELHDKLKGITDEGEQFSAVLDFIKGNIGDLDLNIQGSEQALQNIERIQTALEDLGGEAQKVADDTAEAFAGPIDIQFLLNDGAVRQMTERIKASVRDVRDTGIADGEELNAEFTKVFTGISSSLSEAFGTEKITALHNELNVITDQGEKFSAVLDFIKENIGDLDLDIQGSEQALQNIERIQSALEDLGGEAQKVAADTAEAFAGPIDIQFLLNDDAVRQMAERIKASVRDVRDTGIADGEELNAEFTKVFAGISTSLSEAFGTEKVTALHNELNGITDQGEKFNSVLDFIKGNIGDLNLDIQGSDQALQNIERIQSALEVLSSGAREFSSAAEEAFDIAGMSVEQMEERLDRLIERERSLRQAILNAHDPELLEAYNRGLSKTIDQENQLAAALDKANASRFQPPEASGIEETTKSMQNQINVSQALTGSIRGLYGAISTAAVVTQLFAGDNTDIQKTMAKLVTAYMAVRGAVDAVRNVRQIGNTVLLISNTLRKKSVIAQTEETAASAANATAKGVQTAATNTATVAQQGLNTAMSANPIGAVVLAVTALASVVAVLALNTKDATEKQIELNQALEETNKALAELAEMQTRHAEEQARTAHEAVELARAQGRSQKEINALQQEAIEAEKEVAKQGLETLGVTEKETRELRQQANIKQTEIVNAQKKLAADIKKENLSSKELDNRKQIIDKLQSELGVINAILIPAERYLDTLKDANAALEKNLADIRRQNADADRRGATASAEARVAAQKKGTKEWLEAEKNAIETRKNIALQAQDLTRGEISKILQDARNETEAAERQFRAQQLQNQISLAKAVLASAKEGSIEEFNARSALVELQAELEINQANVSKEKRIEIEAKAQEELSGLRRKYNRERSEEELQTAQANIEARLAQETEGTEEALKLHKDLMENQAAQEVLRLQESVKNEEERAAKERAIYAKLEADKLRLNDKFIEQRLQRELAASEDLARQQLNANRADLNQPGTTALDRYKAQVDEINIQIRQLTRERHSIENALSSPMRISAKYAGELSAALARNIQISKKLAEEVQKLMDNKTFRAFTDIADKIRAVGQTFQKLSQDLRDVNPALADTLQTMAEIADVGEDAANAVAGIAGGAATGNPLMIIQGVSSAISAIGGVIKMFGRARASARKAAKELADIHRREFLGALEYNRLIQQRKNDQQDLNDLSLRELEIKRESLKQDLAAEEARQEAIRQRLLAEGEIITGHHTKKTGFLRNRTKIVEELARLQIDDFDRLEELDLQGNLTEPTQQMADALKSSEESADAIRELIEEAGQRMQEIATGTLANTISDNIIRGFSDGKRSAADFADDFEGLMRGAILSSLQANALKGPIEDFYKKFAEFSQSNGGLDRGEIAQLQDMYGTMIESFGEQFEQIQSITGINFNDQRLAGLSGAIQRTITEDTANELSGLVRGEFETVKRSFSVLSKSLEVQLNIEANTGNMVIRMDGALEELRRIRNNTKPVLTARDQGRG